MTAKKLYRVSIGGYYYRWNIWSRLSESRALDLMADGFIVKPKPRPTVGPSLFARLRHWIATRADWATNDGP